MIFFWIPLHKNTPNFLLLCYRRLNFFTGSLLGALPRGCNPIDLPFYRYGGHIELIRFLGVLWNAQGSDTNYESLFQVRDNL